MHSKLEVRNENYWSSYVTLPTLYWLQAKMPSSCSIQILNDRSKMLCEYNKSSKGRFHPNFRILDGTLKTHANYR